MTGNNIYKRTEKILYGYKYLIADYKSYSEVLNNLQSGADISLPAFIYNEMPKSQTNKITDPVCNSVIEREKQIKWVKNKLKLIEAKINKIEIPKQLLTHEELSLFNRRYIQEESWKDIYNNLNYSKTNIYRIKKRMISKFMRYL